MNQIYNLAQTIAADKETIAKLEKHLLNAKSILAAHENAMERLTTVPNVIVSDKGIVAAGGLVREDTPVRERITLESYWGLDIQIGDKVDVVLSGDVDFNSGETYAVENVLTQDLLEVDHRSSCLFDLERSAVTRGSCWYDYDTAYDHELYLIRTPEGSLNK
mgnify:CR=1 FL=1